MHWLIKCCIKKTIATKWCARATNWDNQQVRPVGRMSLEPWFSIAAVIMLTFPQSTYGQHFWCGFQIHLEVWISEVSWMSVGAWWNSGINIPTQYSVLWSFLQMNKEEFLTVLCFCDEWISADGPSKFGASSARRRHSWAYSELYFGSSRALSTI